MTDWYRKVEGNMAGPFSLEELRFLIGRGKLTQIDQVREGKSGPWLNAGTIESLFPPEPRTNVPKRHNVVQPAASQPRTNGQRAEKPKTETLQTSPPSLLAPSGTTNGVQPPPLPDVDEEDNTHEHILIGAGIGLAIAILILLLFFLFSGGGSGGGQGELASGGSGEGSGQGIGDGTGDGTGSGSGSGQGTSTDDSASSTGSLPESTNNSPVKTEPTDQEGSPPSESDGEPPKEETEGEEIPEEELSEQGVFAIESLPSGSDYAGSGSGNGSGGGGSGEGLDEAYVDSDPNRGGAGKKFVKFVKRWQFTDEGFIDGGQNGKPRTYHDPSKVPACPWSISQGGRSLTLKWEDDWNCKKHNKFTQKASANATIMVERPLVMTISWSGMGETQAQGFEIMSLHLNGNLIGSAHAPGGGKGCAGGMASVVSSPPPPQQVSLKKGENIVKIEATTNDPLYHFNAWYRFELSYGIQ